jgi:hypothetical protein
VDLYKRRTAPAVAVKFTGDPADLDEILRDTAYKIRIRDTGVWQIIKNGIPTLLLISGEWVIRQRNGDIQVLGNEEFHRTYERVSWDA